MSYYLENIALPDQLDISAHGPILSSCLWVSFCVYLLPGAVDYPCFRGLLKQLVGPLSSQLSDRRSSIVKQVCLYSTSVISSYLVRSCRCDWLPCWSQGIMSILFTMTNIYVPNWLPDKCYSFGSRTFQNFPLNDCAIGLVFCLFFHYVI